jgi:uncharacterized protein (TIGR02231 family)
MSKMDTVLGEVVVYPDRARPTRRGKATLQAGRHQLEIDDLPLRMNPDSARVAARGTAHARLLGLQVKRTFYTVTPTEQVRKLEAQVEAAQDDMSSLDAQLALVAQHREKLDALGGHTKVFAKALASGAMSVEAQLALFDGLRTRVGEFDAERQELQVRKRDLDRRLLQLQKQLDQVRSALPRERFTALVDLEVTQAGELGLEFSYVVSGAGWVPLYDLRLLEEEQEIALEVGYLAQVTQQTGEDWNDVAITLSTARPALAATVPELNPWYLRPKPVEVVSERRPASKPMRAMAMSAEMKAASPTAEATTGDLAQEDVEAVVSMARVDQSGASITYTVEGKSSVPADGAPHKVNVARYSLIPKLDYVTAPGLVEAIYRRAKVVNDSPYTLLPGLVNLFAREEFIGGTRLELTAPQGEIELYLGVDDRVKVERELLRREVDKSLIGGKRRIHCGYGITLENLRSNQSRITVHDQIPMAQHEDIKVRLETCEPKPTKQSELNLLDWELVLAPKEKRLIRFDFTIEYPQGMELLGI